MEVVQTGINTTPKIIDFSTALTEMQIKIFTIEEEQLKWEIYNEDATWLDINPISGTLNTPDDTET